MHHASDPFERLVYRNVRRRVGRGSQVSIHLFAVQVKHDHVFRLHLVIGHAARLDDDEPAFPVDAAHVSPGEYDKAMPDQLEIRLENLFFQFLKHSLPPYTAAVPVISAVHNLVHNLFRATPYCSCLLSISLPFLPLSLQRCFAPHHLPDTDFFISFSRFITSLAPRPK